ncbi:MAG: DNA polymerase I [Candidatus Buchananbacteria bacterium]|nr:DNA polymerase I [Candidatus Buchananbacteria bacterium]
MIRLFYMSQTKQKLMLVDGHALIHRAFHALPPLTTKDGELVNAVYGFTTIFLKALRELKPDYVAVTFDKARKTFRDEIYTEYKAQREAAPPELYEQTPKIKKLLKLFHVPVYEIDNYEADDLIGTICNLPEINKANIETIIVSGDLDLLQLVDNNTKMYGLKRGISDTIIYDPQTVKQKYEGLKPEQIIDFKALKGDPSDNIPGVKGVGEKTAILLLNEFKTLDNIYKNIDSTKIKDSVRQKLIQDKEQAYLSQKLATINQEAPIKFKLTESKIKSYDKQAVIDLLQEYQFASLANKLPDLNNKQATSPDKTDFEKINQKQNYLLIKTEKELDGFLQKLKKQKAFAFDTETTGLDPFADQLLGISFCWQANQAYYVPIAEIQGEGLFENIKIKKDWLIKLQPFLENPQIEKIGHNLKFDSEILLNQNIKVNNLFFDTMLASYLLAPGSRAHGLDNLVFTELGHQMISYNEVTEQKKLKITQVPLEKLANYSCEDADYTWRLFKLLNKKISDEKLNKLLQEIEMPLVPILIEMEYNGIKINQQFLQKLSQKINKQIKNISQKIYKLAGTEFNIASPMQLKEILFDKLAISTKGIGKTKTGFSTAAEQLEKLRGQHKIIDLISEYRELSKLKTTYIDSLPKLINPKTKRIHTSFNQTITATGRLSSSDPNLQNIPIKTELGREIRQAFIAEKDYQFIAADYSQIELRIVASLANDKNMIKAFKQNQDIHTITAAKIHNLKPEQVDKDLRRSAKEINFGIMYGMGPRGVSLRTGIPLEKAKEFIDKYFQAFPKIKKYIEATKDFAHKNGYVETIFGRRRYLPDIQSGVPHIAASAERMAINMPIQGAAADLIKMAMIKIHDKLPEISSKTKLILQVHDELIFEVPKADLSKVAKFVKKEMEDVNHHFKTPIKVDIETGKNWGELN